MSTFNNEDIPESHLIREKIKVYKDADSLPEEVEVVRRKIVNNPNKTPMPRTRADISTQPNPIPDNIQSEDFDNTFSAEDDYVNKLIKEDFERNGMPGANFKLGAVTDHINEARKTERGHYVKGDRLIDAAFLREVADLKCKSDLQNELSKILTTCVEKASEGDIYFKFEVKANLYFKYLKNELANLSMYSTHETSFDDPNTLTITIDCS